MQHLPNSKAQHPSAQPLIFRDYALWVSIAIGATLLVYLLSTVLMPFIAAALVAYMLEPSVRRLELWKIRRSVSSILSIVGLSLIVIGLLSLLVPLITKEIVPLMGRIPELPNRLITLLSQKFPSISWDKYLQPDVIRTLLIDQQDLIKQILQALQSGLLKGGGSAFQILANALLFPVALFYFILAWPKFSEHAKALLPPKTRHKVLTTLDEIDRVLAEYLRGQMLVVLALSAYYALGLTLIDLPHGFSLGVLTGLLVLLPYLGFVLGFLLSLLMVLITGDSHLLGWVVLIFAFGQILESYLLTPFLVGERIGLHPLAVIFSLLAFGQLLGFVGILLALPASAILLVLLRHLKTHYQESKFYQLS